MSALTDLNTRINKLFRNPNINFFIIMLLILIITCYTLISTPIKNTISIIISNPIIILFAIIAIVIIGYFDINIAVLLLILFFVALFGMQYTTSNNTLNNTLNTVENFDNADSDLEEEVKHISRIDNNLKIKAENDKKTDERVNNIKNVVLSTINKFRNQNDNDYKRAILENKKMMFQEEKQNNNKINKIKSIDANNSSKDSFKDISSNKKNNSGKANGKSGDNKSDGSKSNGSKSNGSKSNGSKSNGSNGSKEDFQTVKHRVFDPSNEEDTNLLITREILQDMHNRIEFNYENNKYLKKYIKHRVEEIVELNKLLDDE
jgi:Ca2+/Na+ antiporter